MGKLYRRRRATSTGGSWRGAHQHRTDHVLIRVADEREDAWERGHAGAALDGQLVRLTLGCRHARRHGAAEAVPVGLAVLFGNDEVERAADRVARRVAEQLLRAAAPV